VAIIRSLTWVPEGFVRQTERRQSSVSAVEVFENCRKGKIKWGGLEIRFLSLSIPISPWSPWPSRRTGGDLELPIESRWLQTGNDHNARFFDNASKKGRKEAIRPLFSVARSEKVSSAFLICLSQETLADQNPQPDSQLAPTRSSPSSLSTPSSWPTYYRRSSPRSKTATRHSTIGSRRTT